MEADESKVNYLDNFKYYYYIGKPYWITFALVIGIIAVQSLIEVGYNYLYKIIVDAGTQFVTGSIAQEALIAILIPVGVVYVVSMLVLSFSRFYRLNLINSLEAKMMLDIKKDIFDHLINLSHSFHTTHRTGSLISKLIRSGRSIEALTDSFTSHSFPLIFKLLISFAVIAFFDLTAGIIVLIASVAFLALCFYILYLQQQSNIARNEAEDIEKGFISDVFGNIETVKHFGKEKRLSALFVGYGKNSLDKFLEFWNYYSWIEGGFILIFGLGTIALFYVMLGKLMAGTITMGSIVFIYGAYLGLTQPLFEFMWGVRRTYEAMSDMEAIVRYKKIKQEVVDKKGAKPIRITKGAVSFKDVSFNYGKREIISNFTLDIKPKEKLALVGHSGAGKTTVVKLLYRLYDIKQGSIRVDGNDIRDVAQDTLRSEMSIVPQECILFNDSIYNNIAFSKPDATRAEVVRALKVAKLYDFVMQLPDKEKTIVGERGIKLSGGEKQRVSIARAVLANKKILVLDEATSSLDSETERDIQTALFELMKGKTTIIIAHRLSTIMRADKIVVLKKGKVIQVGTHTELTTKTGVYKKLWELQRSKDIRA